MMNVVIECYNKEDDKFQTKFITLFSVTPYVYPDQLKECDLTLEYENRIKSYSSVPVLALYSLHDAKSKIHLNRLKFVCSIINERSLNEYKIKLYYITAKENHFPNYLSYFIEKGVPIFVGGDNFETLEKYIGITEEKQVFLINPHYLRGNKCYQYVLSTGLLPSQIFPRILQLGIIQSKKLVIYSSNTEQEKHMIEYIKNSEYHDNIIYVINGSTNYDEAMDVEIEKLIDNECSNDNSCVLITLIHMTGFSALKAVNDTNIASKISVVAVSPDLKDINDNYDIIGDGYLLDSYFFTLEYPESEHLIETVSQFFGPGYLLDGIAMNIYLGGFLINSISSEKKSTTKEQIRKALLSYEYDSPTGKIIVKPNFYIEKQIFNAEINHKKYPNELHPIILNTISPRIYPSIYEGEISFFKVKLIFNILFVL